MALFKTLPTPTNDLFPRLMVEVCLVLAPDVDFFLNSRKQGLPCQPSLLFFFSFSGHSTFYLLWMTWHNPTTWCSKKGCWSISPLFLLVLLWTSGRGTWIIGRLFLMTSTRARRQTLRGILSRLVHLPTMVRPPYKEGPGNTYALHSSQIHASWPSSWHYPQHGTLQTLCPHPTNWNNDLDSRYLP